MAITAPMTGARSVRLLEDLDRALADRITELQSQRRVIGELLRTQAPVDTLPEFARHIAALQRLGAQDTDAATIALINAVAGFEDGADAEALKKLIDHLADFPAASDLTALEERVHAIGPDAAEQDVAALALDYGQVLTEIYDNFAATRHDGPPWTSDGDMNEISVALVGPTTNDRQRDVLSRATTVLANHIARTVKG